MSIELDRHDNLPPGPGIETIKNLRQKGFVKQGSPLWWSENYSPDPREYMPFEEFRSGLESIGPCTVKSPVFPNRNELRFKEAFLYPNPTVPMTTIELDIDGQSLPFLVTARPYHEKELRFKPFSMFLAEHSLEEVQEHVSRGYPIELHVHFFPHIRGLFAGERNGHFFWYPVRAFSFWNEFGQKLYDQLQERNLSFITFYDPPYSEERTYVGVWEELMKEEFRDLIDQRGFVWPDSEYEEVSAEEFIEDFQNSDNDRLLRYPVRLSGIEHILPLIVSTKTHGTSSIRKPVVLGIYGENGLQGRSKRGGIMRVKDRLFARNISLAVSRDLGLPVDTVLFAPKPGRPSYQRIAA